MADVTHDLIGGTVIQRSFIPSGFTEVLNIATVPISEVTTDQSWIENQEFLRFLTAEILGVPTETLIDEQEYAELKNFFQINNPDDFLRRPDIQSRLGARYSRYNSVTVQDKKLTY